MKLHLRTTGCHLPSGNYMPPNESEHTLTLTPPEAGTRFTYSGGMKG